MTTDPESIERVLREAVAQARVDTTGGPADYIPELANVDLEQTSAAITLPPGETIVAGDAPSHRFTLQSSAKLVVLAGLLEERGDDAVFSVVGTEPSGDPFASLAELDKESPIPANPLINAGAIALCGLLDGELEDRIGWIESWLEKLYGEKLPVAGRVLASERRTGDRNRAIAYLLRANDVLQSPVETTLESYFSLCSYEADVVQASRLPAVLATGGVNTTGERVLSQRTVSHVVALMATCGMYDESGKYLSAVGLPAKSGVSGVIVAVATGRGGIAVASPRVNEMGGSIRGHRMLAHLADALGWHLAVPQSGST